MAILVTGGAGFIGSHTCERLLAQKKELVVADDMNDYYDPALKKKNIEYLKTRGKFTFYKTDIRNYAALEKIFKKHKIDAVIHLAARAGVRPSIADPHLYTTVNVIGTANLLELARKNNVSTFIFGSSSSVYGENKKIPFSEDDRVDNQISPYAATKRMGEVLCKAYAGYGMHVTCLRFFTVYGPRGRPDMAPRKFTEAIASGKKIEVYGDGSMRRDYTYVTDIVDGILLSLEKSLPFEIINLGDNRPYTITELVKAIEKATGKKAKVVYKPVPAGDVPVTYADISKAKRLLGWQPNIKLEQGIRQLASI